MRLPKSLLARMVVDMARDRLAQAEESGEAAGSNAQQQQQQVEQIGAKRRLVDATAEAALTPELLAVLPATLDLTVAHDPTALGIALHVHAHNSICGAQVPANMTLETLKRDVLGPLELPGLHTLTYDPRLAAEGTLQALTALHREAAADAAANQIHRLLPTSTPLARASALFMLIPSDQLPGSGGAGGAAAGGPAGPAPGPHCVHAFRLPQAVLPYTTKDPQLGDVTMYNALKAAEAAHADGLPLPRGLPADALEDSAVPTEVRATVLTRLAALQSGGAGRGGGARAIAGEGSGVAGAFRYEWKRVPMYVGGALAKPLLLELSWGG
ncbi:hypothetical protein HYH03_012872 [Edaphochlamys debaryana]|uniref:Uncharacterized protein n=1 Tax=Edaphochlamys debaryana TaxID=47281 RepID=A0A835XQT5_9CHLO|nr:hypothetical protein HYH03_012872 [Edaphochlamys debaryana]|eukprot:KAG2488553.1 hypothetical protein HYH03_012872 [Edaphochlamys debaryana]